MIIQIEITADLVRALMLKGDKRRTILRKMADPLIRKCDEQKLIEATKGNDRVKDGEINPRFSYSGIRDQMTVMALTSLITGMQDHEQTIAGIAFNSVTTEFGLFWTPSGEVDWDRPYYVLSRLLVALTTGGFNAYENVKGCVGGGFVIDDDDVDVEQVMRDYADGDGDDDATDTPAKAVASSAATITFPDVDASKLGIANTVLEQLGIPKYAEITKAFDDMKVALDKATTGPKGMTVQYNFVGQPNLAAQAGVPAGKFEMKKAHEVFEIPAKAKEHFDFDVPVFTWDASHPYVEEVDPDYQFQPVPLLRLLWALVTNQKAWLHGHTGTGKSTLVEQVSARTGWPMVRINFDSEITRMDLIGRDKLDQKNGQTVTSFEDGILPKAMQMPCILLCDEMDFIRPDVAYVMQRALENKGLLVTEDGGRLVKPDPMFRMVATANTKGAGDDTGRYMGARPQSGAFLDRFTCWIEVDYMSPPAAAKLIKAKVPAVSDRALGVLKDYAKEHWVGFRNGDILQPLSPRGLLSAANAFTFYSGVMAEEEALKHSIQTTISERCSESDAQTIEGLVQRVM